VWNNPFGAVRRLELAVGMRDDDIVGGVRWMGVDVSVEIALNARHELALDAAAQQKVFVVRPARRPQVENSDVFEPMRLKNVALDDGRGIPAEMTVNAAEFHRIAALIGSALRPDLRTIVIIRVQFPDQIFSV